MNRKVWIIAALLVLGAATAAYVVLKRSAEPPAVAEDVAPPPPVAPAPPAPPPLPPTTPTIQHPVAIEPVTEALPELSQSDAPMLKALEKALGKKWLALIVPDDLIAHVVATVDNLPRQRLPAAIVPIKRTSGSFIVSGKDDSLTIDAQNAARYTLYVTLIQSVDAEKLVAVYRYFYPLFQRAYDALGYPNAYFNDRLVEALDDLLATPELNEPIRLMQPKILYTFADPELEARSAGQKIMLRIGHNNALLIKAKVRELRKLVAHA